MKPITKRLVAWGAAAISGAAFFAMLIWGPWLFEDDHVRDTKLAPSAGIIITGFRTALVAVAAGVVAVVGLWYTHKSHKQTEALFEHTRAKDREQAELTREGQVTERYVEAIKLLASKNLTERLGGIYALERIMHDSEKDHATVVAVLAAFVRQHAPLPVPDSDGAELVEGVRHPGPAGEVQAALTVLGRRPRREEDFVLDLSQTDLRGADLREANLMNARLEAVRLEQADLTGADLREAVMFFANLDEAVLEETDARDACFGDTMNRAFMKGARLEGAHLSSTQLRFARMEGVDADRAALHHADMTGADLTHASLRGAKWTGAELKNVKLWGANLTDASNLTVEQILSAKPGPTTQLPPEIAANPQVIERARKYLDWVLTAEEPGESQSLDG